LGSHSAIFLGIHNTPQGVFMGRKSLLRSTAKKTSARKKVAPEKPVQESEAKKKIVKKQIKASPKAASAKKAAVTAKAKAKTMVKPKAKRAAATVKAKTTKPKKTAKSKKAKVSLKDLLFKRFDTAPAKVAPPQKKAAVKIPDAPPFVTGYGKEETQRIRTLLFKKFHLKTKPAKKAAPTKKRKVALKDLVFKKFDTAPAKVAPPQEKAAVKIPDAPPVVTGYGKEETERIRTLLFKEFDLKTKSKAPAAKKAAPTKKAPAAPAPPPKLPEDTPPASVLTQGPGGMGNGMKAGLCALAVLIVIIFAASLSNRDRFYLKSADGTLQVWRGRFAPTGKELVISLHGMKAPKPARDVYAKKEVDPIVFGYLQRKANKALNDQKGPDLAKIKRYLHQAESYAPTNEQRREVQVRLKGIDFIVLLHKADFAMSRGTLSDLKAAKSYLARAGSYASSDYHREVLAKTRKAVDRKLAALKKK